MRPHGLGFAFLFTWIPWLFMEPVSQVMDLQTILMVGWTLGFPTNIQRLVLCFPSKPGEEQNFSTFHCTKESDKRDHS